MVGVSEGGPRLLEDAERNVYAHILQRMPASAPGLGTSVRPRQWAARRRFICGRLLEDEPPCQMHCRHPEGHDSFHSYECMHTRPPDPPTRPPPDPFDS